MLYLNSMTIPTKPSAAAISDLLTRIPTVGPTATVAEVLTAIRRRSNWDTINYVYVLDDKRSLIGVVSIKELLRSQDSTVIGKIMKHDPAGIAATADHDRAAVVAIQHNIKAVPIFKSGSREFLGIVGADRILDILHDEHVENFLRFSGIVRQHPTVNILKASVGKLVKARLPWLAIGILGGMVSVTLISQFQTTLEKQIALAFFIPIIVYISNAVGIQTQTLLIRLLAAQKVKTKAFVLKELSASALLALVSALSVGAFAWLWFNNPPVAVTVGLAIFLATVAATLVASGITFLLYATKNDPALGGGPFATAIQDLLTLIIYFLIAAAIIL